MKRWMTGLGTVLVTMTNTGCAPVVLDPLQPGGSTSTATGGGTAPAASTNVIAILAKDLPAGDPSSPFITFEVPVDPDALVLLFSSAPEPCASPQIGATCTTDVWQSALVLPPDLVRVGLVDLGNPRISAYQFTYFGGSSDGACSGGGGGGGPGEGTLEIVSTDAGSITVSLISPLAASSAPEGPATLQGTFTASRCEPAPAPPPPNAAVAILGADLPAGLPASPTIGASPDPTALYQATACP